MVKVMIDGKEHNFSLVSKTRPIAEHDFDCCWAIHQGPHIKAGEQYIRFVYKLDDKFESDHVCLACAVQNPEM